jgi:hypothetical protein
VVAFISSFSEINHTIIILLYTLDIHQGIAVHLKLSYKPIKKVCSVQQRRSDNEETDV